MYRVEQTAVFARWLKGVRDERAQQKIAQRLFRLQGGDQDKTIRLAKALAKAV